MKEIKRSKLPVIYNICWNVIYSIRDIVNNTIIILYGDRWLLTYLGDSFMMYLNIESLCGTLETNIILYINYTSIKKFQV